MNYIIAGVQPMPTAQELKNTILRHLPRAKLSFNPDPLAVAFQRMNKGVRWDETPAATEWNWRAGYDLEAMVEDFINELREHPTWYV